MSEQALIWRDCDLWIRPCLSRYTFEITAAHGGPMLACRKSVKRKEAETNHYVLTPACWAACCLVEEIECNLWQYQDGEESCFISTHELFHFIFCPYPVEEGKWESEWMEYFSGNLSLQWVRLELIWEEGKCRNQFPIKHVKIIRTKTPKIKKNANQHFVV